MTIQRIVATPEQSQAIQANVDAMEDLWVTRTVPAVAQRWVFWRSITEQARGMGVPLSAIFGGQLVQLNKSLDAEALGMARMLHDWAQNTPTVYPWSVEGSGALRYAVVNKPPVYSELDGLMFLVPGAIWIVSNALNLAVLGGSLYFADAYLTASQLESKANLAYAETQTAAVTAIAAVAKRDPAAALKLADALKFATTAAQQPSAIDKLLKTAGRAADAAASGISDILPWVVGAYLLSQRKKAS